MQSFAQVEAYKQAAADAAAPAETIIAILQQPIDVQAIQVCLLMCCIDEVLSVECTACCM